MPSSPWVSALTTTSVSVATAAIPVSGQPATFSQMTVSDLTAEALVKATTGGRLTSIAPVANAVLTTDASGNPVLGTSIPTAVQIGGAYVYRVGGTDVAVADGGTGKSSWTANGIVYASGTTTLANGSVLTFDGSVLSNANTTNVTAANTGAIQTLGGFYAAQRIASAMSVLAGGLYSPYGLGFNTSKAVYAGETNVINSNVLTFDGSGDYVNVGDLTELNSVSTFTLGMTVVWNDLTNPATNKALFIKQVDTSNRIFFYHSTAGLLILTIRNADTSVASIAISSLPIVVGRDHRLVVKFDGAGATNADRIKLFFDGTEYALSFTGTIPSSTANLAGASAYISFTTTTSWNGTLKRYKIWTSVLSSGDTTSDNQGTEVGSPVHFWKMNEGSLTTVTDYGSNPMNGTITGATWSTSQRMGLGVPFPRTLLSFPAQTTREYGLNWGNDVWFYRSAAGIATLEGDLNLTSGKVVKVNGTQVLAAQGAAVADASGGATVDTEARAAINALLARLRAHGIIAT